MNANDYRKLASAKRAEAMDVELPSGAVWKLREPPIQQFIMAGKLPTSMAAKLAKLAKESDSADGRKAVLNSLDPGELVTALAFGRDLLLSCAVEPVISLNPTSDTEIAPEDIMPEDFTFLMNWVLSGGKSGESLDTFPEGTE